MATIARDGSTSEAPEQVSIHDSGALNFLNFLN